MQQKSSENLQIFRVRLKACADRLGLTQAEIARRLGVNPPRVGNWFQGANRPRKGEAVKLADILSVPVDFLMKGVDASPANPTIEESPVLPHRRIDRKTHADEQAARRDDTAEDQAEYDPRADKPRTLRHPNADDGGALPQPHDLTRDGVERLAARLIDTAAQVPGGLGYAQVQLTLCLATLEKLPR